jgi:exonuclease III
MRTYAVFAAIVLFALVSCKDRTPSGKSFFSIATFNCYFLWDGVSPEEGNPNVQFPHKGNRQKAMQHMSDIAQVIRELDADIINLAEVENYDALQCLNDSFLVGMGYHIGFVQGTDHFTGQDVALLSKFPIQEIFYYPEKGRSGEVEKSVSKNYVAGITVNDIELTVIGIHFLAGPLDKSRIHQRQAQARAIQQIATERAQLGHAVVILGDINDFEGDSCCIDLNGNLPVTEVLRILKEMDPACPSDDLVNALGLVEKHSRYTAHWDKDGEGDVDAGELSAIDHILVSPKLAENMKSCNILQHYNPLEVSDHFPMIVQFALEQ